MTHRRATYLPVLLFAIAGCGPAPAPQTSFGPGRAGKGDSAWASDAKNLEGLPGKYVRADGAPGELAVLEIGATTVPHALLAPLGTLAAECTTQRVCVPGATCRPDKGQCAALLRHASVDVSVLVVQGAASAESYVIEALDRDAAQTVVRLTLRPVGDAGTLADPQPAILLQREGHTPPKLITDIDNVKGLGGAYLAPTTPGVELARLELAAATSDANVCGIFHRWVFPAWCESDTCAVLQRGIYRATPRSNAATGAAPARLVLEQDSGAKKSYAIQGQLRSASGNVTHLVLREELAGRLGPELVLERSYPQVPASNAVNDLAGLEGFYEREGVAPARSLLELDLGQRTAGQGTYSLTLTTQCSIARTAEQGTYRAIPENPVVGFASISFTDSWGNSDSYLIDAVERDGDGAVTRLILRPIASDMTDPSAEPWIIMRRLP